ncbi:MAG: glycosyltransferase [Dehalococcoidales bacterium]|nr:glycosyltransferase [Dehalococcoidales bacterium]
MRICFVNTEIFAFGYYGGYGRLNRVIGRELVKRGHQVNVIVMPRQAEQPPVAQLDGMTVYGFDRTLKTFLFSNGKFRLPEADIIEIWDPNSLIAYLVTRATPHSKHIVDIADPWDKQDFKDVDTVEHKRKSMNPRDVAQRFYMDRIRPRLAQKVIHKADAFFYEADYLLPKMRSLYSLKADCVFMPHAVEIPAGPVNKAPRPTVCFLARWDAVKRVERFFQLAGRFPEADFIAMGWAHDKEKDRQYREEGSRIPNLAMPGFVSEEEKRNILEKSWVMVNTSIHEGLPQSFIESSACRCAIMAGVNPDNYTSNYGCYVENDDYESGLSYLLGNNRWKEKGEAGYAYVKETRELNSVVEKRISVYERLVKNK